MSTEHLPKRLTQADVDHRLQALDSYDGIERLGPRRLKLDATLGAERLWFWGLAGFAMAGVFLLLVRLDGVGMPPHLDWWSAVIMWACFGLAGLFGGLYFITDIYYVLDLEAQSLVYLVRVPGLQYDRKAHPFSDIAAVVSVCQKAPSSEGEGALYRVCFLSKKGAMLRVTDEGRDAFAVAQDIATQLGALLDRPVYLCEEGAPTAVHKKAGKITVQQGERTYRIDARGA